MNDQHRHANLGPLPRHLILLAAGKTPYAETVCSPGQAGLAQLVQLGQTVSSWASEIARMWRFTRSNGITEGFHNKMETITRQSYGFRNFENSNELNAANGEIVIGSERLVAG